ncbi:MAG: hypothetical protein LM577_08170 [Thermoproteaceae archaeon]|nr:hypothetical protein [Thermoproteaceae archaeon]
MAGTSGQAPGPQEVLEWYARISYDYLMAALAHGAVEAAARQFFPRRYRQWWIRVLSERPPEEVYAREFCARLLAGLIRPSGERDAEMLRVHERECKVLAGRAVVLRADIYPWQARLKLLQDGRVAVVRPEWLARELDEKLRDAKTDGEAIGIVCATLRDREVLPAPGRGSRAKALAWAKYCAGLS